MSDKIDHGGLGGDRAVHDLAKETATTWVVPEKPSETPPPAPEPSAPPPAPTPAGK